ncbi:MAG: class I SAM-dependent methyltransferase [Alphaproteobacteria bacterium]|nr:class I SAM-dependent methyltransferase [Alphaproteobacteria bacterium]
MNFYEEKVVKTTNKMGYMFNEIKEYGRDFIEYSSPGPVLDIGAAYGVHTLPALERGAYVVCNDLEKKHLEILEERVPQEYKSHVEFVCGKFPQELHFRENSFSGILLSHVLHFLKSDEIEEGISKVFGWLKPGGKVFAIVGTPYIKIVEGFIPTFKKRLESGQEWPGFIEDISIYHHERCKDLPKFMHYFDIDVVRRVFKDFIIEKCGYINRDDFPEDMRLDGRENVGVIARKPIVC